MSSGQQENPKVKQDQCQIEIDYNNLFIIQYYIKNQIIWSRKIIVKRFCDNCSRHFVAHMIDYRPSTFLKMKPKIFAIALRNHLLPGY